MFQSGTRIQPLLGWARKANVGYEANTYSRTSMLEHIWNHENMFETGVVRAKSVKHSAMSGGIIGIIFSIFLHMKVFYVFS